MTHTRISYGKPVKYKQVYFNNRKFNGFQVIKLSQHGAEAETEASRFFEEN